MARLICTLAVLFSGIGPIAAATADTPGRKVAEPVAEMPSPERARVALAQAEQAVNRAAAQRALWTTAEEALLRARAAFDKADYSAAWKEANAARELAELGMSQKSYPPLR
jgi:poly(3-hydroxybutyrate) depolymerase